MTNLNSPTGVGQSSTTAADPYGAHADPYGATSAETANGSDLSALAADAGEATHQVVDTAKQETRSVASEAGRQAKMLAGQVRDELRDQAATQQTRAADGLHATGSAFTKMADGSDDSGYAPQLVRAAGERIDSAANWLGTRDPAAVVEDVKRFARRRPGVFIAIAVGAGIFVGRVTRALATSSDAGDSNAPATRSSTGNGFNAPPAPPARQTAPPSVSSVGAPTGMPSAAGVGSPLQAKDRESA